MICYRDMTFCSAECATLDCPSQFTDEHREKAQRWWGDGPGGPPVAFADFSGHCDKFSPPQTGGQIEEPRSGDEVEATG